MGGRHVARYRRILCLSEKGCRQQKEEISGEDGQMIGIVRDHDAGLFREPSMTVTRSMRYFLTPCNKQMIGNKKTNAFTGLRSNDPWDDAQAANQMMWQMMFSHALLNLINRSVTIGKSRKGWKTNV